MTTSPHDQVVEALATAGWAVIARSPLGKGSNPSRLHIRRGRRDLRLLVYAWRITSEGKGRSRDDLRVQVTRSPEGPLIHLPGYLTCGIGIHHDIGVFGAFDPWVKRYASHSSSVHFPQELLDRAARDGTARRDTDDHGPQLYFRPETIPTFLDWAVALSRRRVVKLAAGKEDFKRDGETAAIVAERQAQPLANWVRLNDHIVVTQKNSSQDLLDGNVWIVDGITWDKDDRPRAQGAIRFDCRRHGVIEGLEWLKRVRP